MENKETNENGMVKMIKAISLDAVHTHIIVLNNKKINKYKKDSNISLFILI